MIKISNSNVFRLHECRTKGIFISFSMSKIIETLLNCDFFSKFNVVYSCFLKWGFLIEYCRSCFVSSVLLPWQPRTLSAFSRMLSFETVQ